MYFIIKKALIKITICFMKTNDRKVWKTCENDHRFVGNSTLFHDCVLYLHHIHPFSSQ